MITAQRHSDTKLTIRPSVSNCVHHVDLHIAHSLLALPTGSHNPGRRSRPGVIATAAKDSVVPPALLSPHVAIACGNIGAMPRSSRLLHVPRLLPRPRRSRQQIGEGDVCGSQLLQSRLSHGLQVSPALEVAGGGWICE